MSKRHRQPSRRPRHKRRGSILILVVSVLVLLAITATVYVGVGRMDRLSATAEELKTHRESVSDKVFDYIGQILVLDLYGNRINAPYPFYDSLEPLNFGPLFSDYPQLSPERWDFPYTRPGNSDLFNVQADPWLADVEPVDTTGDGLWDHWRHISNIHPQGRYIDVGGFFSSRSSLAGSGFYNNLFLTRGDPYDFDTFTNFNGNDPFVYTRQMDQQVTDDLSSDDVVSWADQRLGADTDGDGRIDARWTELLNAYGLPKEIRFFVATRIIDASGLLNLNANWEFGAKAPFDSSDQVGWGQTPADVDLYNFLYDAYVGWGGSQNDQAFIDGPGVGGQNKYGFRQHVQETGFQSAYMGGLPYSLGNRSTRINRRSMWHEVARNPYRSVNGLRTYGPADEIELRTNFFMPNDRGVSRLESNFDGLNSNPFDANTWHSPLRNRTFIAERLDYANGTPTRQTLSFDVRHLLTTLNGARPVRPWNLGWAANDTPGIAINPNVIIAQADADPRIIQELVGGFMWALAPYAIDRGDPDGTDIGQTIYGTSVFWQPASASEQFHYGDGDAGYALYKSAQMAMNAVDAFDNDDVPKARTLRMGQTYSDPTREVVEIIGEFQFGRVPAALPGPNGDQTNATITMFGLEAQPFIREVTAVNVYANLDDNPVGRWDYNPSEGDPDEWAVAILAVEIGNPFSRAIDLSNYRLQYGDNQPWDLSQLSNSTLNPGDTVVLYVARENQVSGVDGLGFWMSAIDSRQNGGTPDVMRRIGDDATPLQFESGTGSKYDTVLLWRNDFEYGTLPGFTSMLVDRLEPSTHDENEFPNIIDSGGEDLPNGGFNDPLIFEYTARVGSMRRYSSDSSGGVGFPGYVLESSESIAADGRAAGAEIMGTPVAGGAMVPAGLIETALDDAPDFMNSPDDNKGYTNPPAFAPLQFVVPDLEGNPASEDREFRSAADLLLLSSVGHLHLEQILANDPNFSDPDFYATVSEQLGDERLQSHLINRGIDPVALSVIRPADELSNTYPPDFRIDSNGAANRFVGKLDFTRFIPFFGSQALPYEAIPLAARILDAFETMPVDPNVPLVQGRININTAPQRVLEALPYLNPRYAVGPIPDRDNSGNGLFMARALRAYRDGLLVNTSGANSIDWSAGPRHAVSNLLVTNSSGLRDDAGSRFVGANELKPGFTSLGELLLATRWTAPNGPGTSHALDPSVPLDESPYRTGYDNVNTDYAALAPDPGAAIATPDFDPADDPGEQIALVRAIRNSVSIRSDVFIAYVTLVGFTPGDVRKADEGGGNVTAKLARLKPSMEQRYMVVFDRSNVKLPTDRPRVLFAVQEVPTR